MNHHAEASSWTLSSNSSWGTVTGTASGYPGFDPSSPQSSGTDRSKTPFGSVSTFSLGSQDSYVSGSSWGSQTTLVHGAHPSPSPSSYMSYPASPLSTASTVTLVNAPVGVQGLPHLGYPTCLSGPSPRIQIHPSLHDGRMSIDFARAPPSVAPPTLLVSAFNPAMTYMEVQFEGFPQWTLRIHTTHGLTMWDILGQIYHHLQDVDQTHTRAVHNIGYSRDQNSRISRGRRIDSLGHRTKLAGFKPTGGANGWLTYFSF